MINSNLNKSLSEYCAKIGKNNLLVQGAGGNASFKNLNYLWVKASGTCLADALKKEIFVCVDLNHLNEKIKMGDFTTTPKLCHDSKLKPSIETLLHAILPQKVVLHLHAVEILSHLVRENCEEELLCCNENSLIKWICVDYKKPGAHLVQEIYQSLIKNPETNVVFLKNHGVVIAGENVEEVDNILTILNSLFKINPINRFIPKKTISNIDEKFQNYSLINDDKIQQLALNNLFYSQLEKNWALYPDHVVFLGALPHCFSSWDNFSRVFQEKITLAETLPELIFIENEGVFAQNSFYEAKKEQLRCY